MAGALGTTTASSQSFPGSCQTNPGQFSPKMTWGRTPNFGSQMNVCIAQKAAPVGLGVTMMKTENADCSGRQLGFFSLAFGDHNVTNQIAVPNETTDPPVYTSLSCSQDSWTSVDQVWLGLGLGLGLGLLRGLGLGASVDQVRVRVGVIARVMVGASLVGLGLG